MAAAVSPVAAPLVVVLCWSAIVSLRPVPCGAAGWTGCLRTVVLRRVAPLLPRVGACASSAPLDACDQERCRYHTPPGVLMTILGEKSRNQARERFP